VDLLKLDIEGAEYNVFSDILLAPDTLLPKQLLVEVHELLFVRRLS
jgi:hypothetical protein